MKDYKPPYSVLLEEIDRSRERIKALEGALRGGIRAVNEAYMQAIAEAQGRDRVANRHDQFIVTWKAEVRALLKEADQ